MRNVEIRRSVSINRETNRGQQLFLNYYSSSSSSCVLLLQFSPLWERHPKRVSELPNEFR
jgi:hypothetical protein